MTYGMQILMHSSRKEALLGERFTVLNCAHWFFLFFFFFFLIGRKVVIFYVVIFLKGVRYMAINLEFYWRKNFTGEGTEP